ncbi:MAG: HAD family hydrolase [Solirubrobacteraceae bacterium]
MTPTPTNSPVKAVISDFGGVLTSPLIEAFIALGASLGMSLETLGIAMAAVTENGSNPLFELETGRISEASFLHTLGAQLSAQLGREIELHGFGERYFEQLHPNERLIEYMRELRDRGYKLAICTNNVREWEALWRAKLPVEEIFDVVVNSALVGARKPEPRIYEVTLERLGLPPGAALLLDDVELNCAAARQLGIGAVQFRSTEQAIEEIETALA